MSLTDRASLAESGGRRSRKPDSVYSGPRTQIPSSRSPCAKHRGPLLRGRVAPPILTSGVAVESVIPTW